MLLTDELGPDKTLEPVCKPCGESYVRRPALRARIVPLHVHRTTPLFKGIAGGHRLIDHPFHEAACHDCLLLGSVEHFRQGRIKGLHGCRFRPESVTSRDLPVTNQPFTTLDELASRWLKYVTHEIGMGIGDWHPIKDNSDFAATFTFRDREYGLQHTLSGTYVWAEKRENRGQPMPEIISPELQDSYKQVVFRFYDLINKYESTYFATYTPGREDVILYTPEGRDPRCSALPGPGGHTQEPPGRGPGRGVRHLRRHHPTPVPDPHLRRDRVNGSTPAEKRADRYARAGMVPSGRKAGPGERSTPRRTKSRFSRRSAPRACNSSDSYRLVLARTSSSPLRGVTTPGRAPRGRRDPGVLIAPSKGSQLEGPRPKGGE
ncbi:hypothetical protein ACIBLA_36545 [Streptomyces sp. NPDC050433]|uniref:hypothetical protein n=1 Tax=Streptomyces sp. NPDC050433 TaxID=3365615 RepID=UPI0037ACE3FA